MFHLMMVNTANVNIHMIMQYSHIHFLCRSNCCQTAVPVSIHEAHTYAEPPYEKQDMDISKDSSAVCGITSEGTSKLKHHPKIDDTSCYSVTLLKSPSAHIYQTLDKCLEELLQNSTSEAHARNHGYVSDDLLFVDPHYSPIEDTAKFNLPPVAVGTTPDLLPSQDTHLNPPPIIRPASAGQIRAQTASQHGMPQPPLYHTVERTYDKLEPKPSESTEYSYAYSHIMKLKKKLKKLKSKEELRSPDFSTEAASFQLELVQVAAMAGGYEIDPELLLSLENLTKTMSEDSSKHAQSSCTTKEDDIMPTSSKPTTIDHQYQSLTQSTRNVENGYAILVK